MCREFHISVEKSAFEISKPFYNFHELLSTEYYENAEQETECNILDNLPIGLKVFIVYISLVLFIIAGIISTLIIQDVGMILDNIVYICLYSTMLSFMNILIEKYKKDNITEMYPVYIIGATMFYNNPIYFSNYITISIVGRYIIPELPLLFIKRF